MGAIGGGQELLQQWDRMHQPRDSPAPAVAPAVGGEERILVSVRLRPLNERELARNDVCDWECIDDHTIMFRNSFPERALFPTAHTFDRVFRSDCTTRQVYEEAAKQVALSVVSGVNSSVFAYGQTSSGKTYTMTGITEYTITDIFDYIQRHQERAFVLKFSAIEIYNEAVKDLLSSDGAQLRLLDDPDKGTVVEKLTEDTLRDWNHMKELLSICEAQRQIGETSLNEASSRSHQILRLTVESSAREFLGKDNSNTLSASVNFVDLAGSERASQALSAGARLKEGCHINRSLLTLGTVIRKLSKGRNGHIPYRDSKLTRILQSSLGGNARTAIICTMSPARIHLEQSRNTLLFASCAKQVATNAQVNIVMSDKALVKHLQKELARLESELRSPGSAPFSNRSDFLLREKDSKIQKLEKVVKELSEQRDLAQSRLDDLLRVSGDNQSTKLWSGFRDPKFHESNQYDDELSLSESSGVIDQSLDFGFEYISSSNADENYLYLPEVSKEHDESTSQTKAHEFTEASPQEAAVEVSRENSEIDFVEPFRDVECIEMEESTKCRNDNYTVALPGDVEESKESIQANDTNEIIEPVYEQNIKLDGEVDNLEHGSIVDVDKAVRERELESRNRADIQLKPVEEGATVTALGQFQEIETPVRNVVELLPCEPSPWTRPQLRKTRSCRATLANNTSPFWFEHSEQNENTPPSQVVQGFPPIPDALRWRPYSLNYRNETGKSPRAESYASEQIASPDTPNSLNEVPEENIASIHSFMKDLQNMAQRTYNEQVTNGQENDQNEVVSKGQKKILRDVGLDPMQISMESPTHWRMEFERQQREIVMLWHDCNVSLIHRTYFFLLFKGDPSDKIYMEVELRRLSFLKSSFTRSNFPTSDGRMITSTSSLRTLRRERDMLSRQMGKRLTVEEREDLFKQWGIGLKAKQRRLHLARCLWSDPRNMEHNRNSAALVAKLVGLLEPGQGLKEMFGLSFSPQTPRRKSYSFGWKNGVSPL